jgi:hypothetical protein
VIGSHIKRGEQVSDVCVSLSQTEPTLAPTQDPTVSMKKCWTGLVRKAWHKLT